MTNQREIKDALMKSQEINLKAQVVMKMLPYLRKLLVRLAAYLETLNVIVMWKCQSMIRTGLGTHCFLRLVGLC